MRQLCTPPHVAGRAEPVREITHFLESLDDTFEREAQARRTSAHFNTGDSAGSSSSLLMAYS